MKAMEVGPGPALVCPGCEREIKGRMVPCRWIRAEGETVTLCPSCTRLLMTIKRLVALFPGRASLG